MTTGKLPALNGFDGNEMWCPECHAEPKAAHEPWCEFERHPDPRGHWSDCGACGAVVGEVHRRGCRFHDNEISKPKPKGMAPEHPDPDPSSWSASADVELTPAEFARLVGKTPVAKNTVLRDVKIDGASVPSKIEGDELDRIRAIFAKWMGSTTSPPTSGGIFQQSRGNGKGAAMRAIEFAIAYGMHADQPTGVHLVGTARDDATGAETKIKHIEVKMASGELHLIRACAAAGCWSSATVWDAFPGVTMGVCADHAPKEE